MMFEKEIIPVTVVIPVLNGEKFWESAISGIEQQTVAPEKIILVNDGSTDRTFELMTKWKNNYPERITIVDNGENLGSTESVIKVIDLVKTEFIWLRAIDDHYNSRYLEKKFDCLRKFPQAAFAFAKMEFFEQNPEYPTRLLMGWGNQERYFDPYESADWTKKQFTSNHIVARTEHFRSVVCREPKLKAYFDSFVNALMMFRYGVCFIPETLSSFYSSEETYSGTMIRDQVAMYEFYSTFFNLMETNKYKDLTPYFVKSGFCELFGYRIADFVFENPEYMTSANLAMIQPNISWRNKKMFEERSEGWRKGENSIFGKGLKRELRITLSWVINHLKAHGIQKLALFGAGEHTRFLLSIWSEMEGPRIEKIIQTDKPEQRFFEGFRLSGVEESMDDIDAVVISSASFETEMYNSFKEVHSNIPIFPLWSWTRKEEKILLEKRLERWLPRMVGVVNETNFTAVRVIVEIDKLDLFRSFWRKYGGISKIVHYKDGSWNKKNEILVIVEHREKITNRENGTVMEIPRE